MCVGGAFIGALALHRLFKVGVGRIIFIPVTIDIFMWPLIVCLVSLGSFLRPVIAPCCPGYTRCVLPMDEGMMPYPL